MVVINNLDDFNKAVEEHNICLVKIGTTWCGPCKVVQKNIENIEKQHSDVYFINIDADEADDEILEKYSVRNVPVILFINNGELISKEIGILTEAQLEDKLNQMI